LASFDWSSSEFLDDLPGGAYFCDAAGLITYFNSQAAELWGRAPRLNDPADRFNGAMKLYHPDGTPMPHDECYTARALQTGREIRGQEFIIERPDGTRVTALAHVRPFRDSTGKILGAVDILVDITERKQAEQSQALLAAIVESSDDAIISKGLDGTIQTWNAGATRIYGYTADEVIGKPIRMLIPNDRQNEEDEILERLRHGERIEHYETIRLRKDGTLVDITVTISPIRDASGNLIGASKIARDISERKQGERDLQRATEALTAQLVDLRRLHEMSVRLATTLDLQSILDETLRTAAAIEGAGMGLLSLVAPGGDILEVRANLNFDEAFLRETEPVTPYDPGCGRCLAEKRRLVIEDVELDPTFADYRAMARRAGFRAAHHTPLVTRDGKCIGVLSTHFLQPHRPTDRAMHLIDLCVRQAVDFIENARLYAELKDADRRKDEFLVTLAHELRNPLAPIGNSLHILRLSGDLSPSAERVREIMERQFAHLTRLVDDLLETSRITRGKIELRKEHVEVATILRSAIETSSPLIAAAGHELTTSLPDERLTLEADPIRLAQVVANLLNNAAKYTERGGRIRLQARREANEAVLSVTDTGMGIPPEMLGRVFEMFSQVDRTLKRSQGGLGIGLTLAKHLVEMHGGRISVTSAGIGQGSEFVVRLPLATSPAPVPHSPLIPPSQSSDKMPAPRRILVVDDAQAAAATLAKLLEKMGQQVYIAGDAAEAIREVRERRPDLVISDIAMPDMDGYELARALRRSPGLDNLVLVALSGYGQDSDRREALEAGFDRHLVKPVSYEALKALLNEVPDRR
jgi:PAS domain S-box-containing protein